MPKKPKQTEGAIVVTPEDVPFSNTPTTIHVSGSGLPYSRIGWQIHGTTYMGEEDVNDDGTVEFDFTYRPNFVQRYCVAVREAGESQTEPIYDCFDVVE